MCEEHCECLTCKRAREVGQEKAQQELLEWQAGCLERVGWYIHYVSPDPTVVSGANIHTHGIAEKFNQPDFQLVFPLPQKVALGILNTLGEAVKSGTRYKHGDYADNVIRGFKVKFIDATESGRPVLRVVLPDPQGNLEQCDMGEPYHKQYLQESLSVPGRN